MTDKSDHVTLLGLTPKITIDVRPAGAEDVLLLQVRNALNRLNPGEVVEVVGPSVGALEDLRAWCHITGNEIVVSADSGRERRIFLRRPSSGNAPEQPDWGMKVLPRSASGIDLRDWLVGRAGCIPEDAPTYYGFVPRGAVIEPGMPSYPFTLNRKSSVWADNMPDLYEQAKTHQWSATTDIPWDQLPTLPDDIERAVCQLMTFLAENEYAAMYIPSKFLARINPQFTEVVLYLGTVINDEARHIEAFTKRALANGGGLQYASALTEWSLHSLMVQEDYFRSSFLLHVLGEGTFLELLAFIGEFAPDPVTAEIVRRARLDEGRHVAYGIGHAQHCLNAGPTRADELVAAAEERAAALQATGGSIPAVIEALAILAGRGSSAREVAAGMNSVRKLFADMAENRVRRMLQIGLDEDTARHISGLHTPNFM